MTKNVKYVALAAIAAFSACDEAESPVADASAYGTDSERNAVVTGGKSDPTITNGSVNGVRTIWEQNLESSEYRMVDGNAFVTLIFEGDTTVNENQLTQLTFELEDVGGRNDVDEEAIRYGIVQYRGEDEGVDIDVDRAYQNAGTLKITGEFELDTPNTKIEDVEFVAFAKRIDDPT